MLNTSPPKILRDTIVIVKLTGILNTVRQQHNKAGSTENGKSELNVSTKEEPRTDVATLPENVTLYTRFQGHRPRLTANGAHRTSPQNIDEW